MFRRIATRGFNHSFKRLFSSSNARSTSSRRMIAVGAAAIDAVIAVGAEEGCGGVRI